MSSQLDGFLRGGDKSRYDLKGSRVGNFVDVFERKKKNEYLPTRGYENSLSNTFKWRWSVVVSSIYRVIVKLRRYCSTRLEISHTIDAKTENRRNRPYPIKPTDFNSAIYIRFLDD